MIDALGKNTENTATTTVIIVTPELEARIVTLLYLLFHLSRREVAGMRVYPLHLPKDCHYHVK